jgi:hypothetical protein
MDVCDIGEIFAGCWTEGSSDYVQNTLRGGRPSGSNERLGWMKSDQTVARQALICKRDLRGCKEREIDGASRQKQNQGLTRPFSEQNSLADNCPQNIWDRGITQWSNIPFFGDKTLPWTEGRHGKPRACKVVEAA